jgi:predicted amidophosphoribosyltransferase
MTINEVKEHLCDLITSYANQLGETQTLETLKEAYKLIEEYDRTAPTAHWDINCDGYYPFCSHCREAAQHMSPYCGNCGAKMVTRRHEDNE